MKRIRSLSANLSFRELSASLRSLHAASAHKDILAAIDTSLVVVDSSLINTANGESRQIASEDGTTTAEQIALSAKALLHGRGETASIMLLLPPDDFVSTRFALGITGEKMLRSALKLQAHTLIPAYDEDLLLGVNGASPEGVALWYPTRQANALFHAFQAQGLFLAAIMPRTLALLQTHPLAGEQILIDEDSQHLTQLLCRDGVILAQLGISLSDLGQPEFASQWEAETARLPPAPKFRSAGLHYWSGLRQTLQGHESYTFFAPGAEKFGRDLLRHKQRKFAGIAAAALLVILCLPFISNWLQIFGLERQVESLREQSAAARSAQANVFAMEEEWGAVVEFPRQDVAGVLLTLNQLIDRSLTAFTLNRGVVDIQGFAQDPALLIEQLAEHEGFYDVGQSRSSSLGNAEARGDRFGIRFSLNGVDFPAYEANYPAVQQQE